MNLIQAIAIVKAINRYLRKVRMFNGGGGFGLDYATWTALYPRMSHIYNVAASEVKA